MSTTSDPNDPRLGRGVDEAPGGHVKRPTDPTTFDPSSHTNACSVSCNHIAPIVIEGLFRVCGGVVVRAATAGDWAALVFDFKLADGTSLAPILLALNDDQMAKFGELATQSARAAIDAAKAARR